MKLEKRIVLTCQAGNVSIGDKTVGISISFSRDSMPIGQADSILCGRRIEMSLKRGNASPDQTTNPPDAQASIKGTVEIKSFRATTKNYHLTLCFMLEYVEPERLHEFAKRECTMTITKSGEIPRRETGKGSDPLEGQRQLVPTEERTTDEPVTMAQAVKNLNKRNAEKVAARTAAAKKKPGQKNKKS